MRSALKINWLFPAAVFAALLCAPHVRAQEPAAAADDGYDGSRQIKFNGFSKARPAAQEKSKTAAPTQPPVYERVDSGAWNPTPRPRPAATNTQTASPPRPAPKPTRHNPRTTVVKHNVPRPVEPSPRPAAESGFVDIGVTVWRLRPGKLEGADQGVSFMTADGLAELVTPVRISGTDPVHLGDRLRFSIESPREGYLYVIDSTQYTDASIEEPELIFPTTRTRGGDNRVTPGRLVYIPALEDDVPYYKVTAEGPAGKVNAGEIINIIFSPRPIPELASLSRDKSRISREMVAKWTSTWGDLARQQQLNLVGGEGRPATRAEHEAGESGGRSLTQEEPTPQTLFRVRANPNGPAMVTLHLVYGDTAARK
jgi:hypothetical protein